MPLRDQDAVRRLGKVVTPTQQKVETLGEFHLQDPERKCLYCGPLASAVVTFTEHARTLRHKVLAVHYIEHSAIKDSHRTCERGTCAEARQKGVL